MIRRRSLTFGVLALAWCVLALPATSGAQAGIPRVLTVGVGGGGTVPVGDFANDVKTGWNALGYFQYQPLSGGAWAVRAEAQYSRAAYTDDFLSDVGARDGDNLSNKVLYAGLSALYHFGRRTGPVRPYAIGGLGLYQLTATLNDGSGVSFSDSETGFGFNGGAGIRFGGAIGIFVETRFHQFSVTPTGGVKSTSQFIPVTVGLTF